MDMQHSSLFTSYKILPSVENKANVVAIKRWKNQQIKIGAEVAQLQITEQLTILEVSKRHPSGWPIQLSLMYGQHHTLNSHNVKTVKGWIYLAAIKQSVPKVDVLKAEKKQDALQ